jgi:putative membrane protein
VALLALIATAVVALLHVGFFLLEAVWWDTPRGRRIFGTSPEFSAASRALAANQGLYNGFLAAGLAWGLLLGAEGADVRIFFLACVLVAGVFGAVTVSRSILLVQGAPAAVALALTLLAG